MEHVGVDAPLDEALQELLLTRTEDDQVRATLFGQAHNRVGWRSDQPWLSLVEAQACSRPVVTMRTESSELLIRHNETGLLAADVDQFRSYLGELLSDRERGEAMGRAAYEHFAAHLSMERQMDRIEALLLEPEATKTSRRCGGADSGGVGGD